MDPKIIANNKEHLIKIIAQSIEWYGNGCNLNHIDVSKVDDFSKLFSNHDISGDPFPIQYSENFSNFYGDISKWDVSNAVNMFGMFEYSEFDGDISNWNVSKVKNMEKMFAESSFSGDHGDISKWDVSNVENMEYMFSYSNFNQDLSTWNPYKLENDRNMFLSCSSAIPYWINYGSREKRKIAIDNHYLQKSLNNELSKNISYEKKIKL